MMSLSRTLNRAKKRKAANELIQIKRGKLRNILHGIDLQAAEIRLLKGKIAKLEAVTE